MLRSESGQNNCPLACPIRISPPVPGSAPWPTPSPDPLPDASSTAPLPAAAALLRPLAALTRRSRLPARLAFPATSCAAPPHTAAAATALTPRAQPCPTACVSSAPRSSTPGLAASSWFVSVPAPACADAPAVAAHRAPPGSAPRSAETDLRSADAAHAPRPAGPSSASEPHWLGSWRHRPNTARCPTPPATARTMDSARKPPSRPAPPGPPATGKTALLPPGAATASVESLPFDCQRSRPAETQDENHSL